MADWLASACHAAIACDVLVISGHYGAGKQFFAEALMRSDSCPSANSNTLPARIAARASFAD
jgi:tRNA A37 threonylcarbamoyladenosine biosynthesis protein TsaE